MLDLEVIDQTIEELENSDTTFFNCQNLASLYIVRDKLGGTKLDKELRDILPTYRSYCEIKKKYQMKELPEEAVINAMTNVSKEVKEFIDTLYSGTDLEMERNIINDMIKNLYIEER